MADNPQLDAFLAEGAPQEARTGACSARPHQSPHQARGKAAAALHSARQGQGDASRGRRGHRAACAIATRRGRRPAPRPRGRAPQAAGLESSVRSRPRRSTRNSCGSWRRPSAHRRQPAPAATTADAAAARPTAGPSRYSGPSRIQQQQVLLNERLNNSRNDAAREDRRRQGQRVRQRVQATRRTRSDAVRQAVSRRPTPTPG